MSWLLMLWLLSSPGHQQPWYWLCRIGRFFSYWRKDFNYLCHINMDEWHKMQIYVFVPSEKLACKGLTSVSKFFTSPQNPYRYQSVQYFMDLITTKEILEQRKNDKIVYVICHIIWYYSSLTCLVNCDVRLLDWPATSHYLKQCWNIVNWTLGKKLQWTLNQNLYIFIWENAFENVVRKFVAILSPPQCVNLTQCCLVKPYGIRELCLHWLR